MGKGGGCVPSKRRQPPAAGRRALVVVRRGRGATRGARGGCGRGGGGHGGGGCGSRAEGAAVHRVLLDVRPRGVPGAARGGGRRRGGRRGGRAAAGPRDAPAGSAGEDAGADQGPRGPRHRVGSGPAGGRRRPVRLPDEVRHHGRADEGILRLHRLALGGAEARREARRVLRQHRNAGRRPGDHCLDGHHPARAPWNAFRPHWLHLWCRHVQHGRYQRRQPLRGRCLCWRRQQTTQRDGTRPCRAPGQVHGLDSEEARSPCMSQPSLCSKSHTVTFIQPSVSPIVF